MSNDPKKINPRQASPQSTDSAPPIPPASPGGEDNEIFDLSELDDIQFGEPLDDALEEPDAALPPPVEAIPFEDPAPRDDLGSLTVGIPVEELPDIPEAAEVHTAVPGSGSFSAADPASAVTLVSDPAPGSSVVIGTSVDNPEGIGNFEPIAPVEPASGWLDDGPAQAAHVHGHLPTEPLGVHQADLFEAPPAIESSDIFSSGPIPTASGVDHSDVIAATAYGHASAAPSDKKQASGELPLAEALPDSGEKRVGTSPIVVPPVMPTRRSDRGNDATDYGSTPIAAPDASSILSDLSEPGEITLDDSSSVRIEAPGVQRTHTSDPGEGTEFDLTISDDPAPPELNAAAADSGDATDWREQSGSDLFAESRSQAEIDLDQDSGRVVPIDRDLTSEEPSLTSAPSSIFTGGKLPGASGSRSGPGSDSVRIGRPEDEDAAVEFSDHPTADSEAASSAALGGPISPMPGSKQPASGDSARKSSTKLKKTLDADEEAGKVDWNAAVLADDSEATIGVPREMLDAPLSGILKRGTSEGSDEAKSTPSKSTAKKSSPAKPVKGGKAKDPGAKEGTDPSVEIDWMAGSSSEEPVVAPEVYDAKPSKKDKSKKEADKKRSTRELEKTGEKKGGGGWIGGTLLGMLIAGGACAGLYYGGVVPNGEKSDTANVANLNRNDGKAPAADAQKTLTLADAHSAIQAGEHAKALKVLDALKAAAPDKVAAGTKAASGQARFFARVQELGKTNESAAAADEEFKKAREDLQAVVDDPGAAKAIGEKEVVRSTIQLGLTYELAGDKEKAKDVYEAGKKKHPNFASTFDAALDRLAAISSTSDGMTLRLQPADAEKMLLAICLLQADPAAKEEDEAGVYFWKAVKLASDGKYTEAADEIKKAKAAHVKQAKAMPGRGLNSLSDPLEQIFPRCCEDLKAYWELRAAIYANKTVADLIKKDGAEKAMSELAMAQKKAIEAVKLMEEVREVKIKLAKAENEYKEAVDKLAIEQKKRLEIEAKARLELVELEESRVKVVRERKKADDLIASLAKELQSANLLPEKFDAPTLLAAQKTAVDRASGPTLTALLPPGMMAIGGPLSAAHLIEVAERLTKAEAATKVATEKLTAETKRLTAEKEEAVKNLKDSHAADVKKMTDIYAAEMKKLMETYATSTTKLKDDQMAELKKMTEKFAVDLKKVTDDNAAATRKLTEGFEGKIKDLEVAIVKEKAAGEAVAAKLRIDISNSVSPAQALDLWLPQLTELRRASDSDPALANAKKVLATAGPDSEDAAKAYTVAGLALLLKGQLDEAKVMFQLARSSPAYKAGTGKEWVKSADIGLASVTDPLAPYRLPVEKPKRDVKAGAFYLDRGISAYKSGRNAEAAKELIDSTKADPTNPVTWYFLGAARWASGAVEQAKVDYRQGSEWEKQSLLSSREISGYLEPIQGASRDALSVARP